MRFAGHQVIQTNERVPDIVPAVLYFKWRAKRHLRKYPPLTPFYHYKIEKVGRFLWAVEPYQNILDPEGPNGEQ